MTRPKYLAAIGHTLRQIVLLELGLLACGSLIGWWAAWRTPQAYGSGLSELGIGILGLACLSPLVGIGRVPKAPGRQDLATRSARMLVLSVAGSGMIGVGVLLTTLFG